MWKMLAEKGKISTVMGMVTVIPVNFKAVWAFFHGSTFTEGQLITLLILNGIGVVWFILPSTIKIISKLLTIEIID